MAVPAIKNGKVDFNSAAALEYLGAPALSKPQQDNMNGIFKQFATITPAGWYNPIAWRLQARYDDPQKKCACGNPNMPYAYTSNQGPGAFTYINFCPPYFHTITLNKMVKQNRGSTDLQVKYNMDQYWRTQGHIWTHELMHIDWVANAIGLDVAYGPSAHVRDLWIKLEDTDGTVHQTKAYEPLCTKILARLPYDTGYYTIKNADNLACFMTSLYIQSEYGSYPHYPLASQDPFGPPFTQPWGDLFIFDYENGATFKLNVSNPLAGGFISDGSDSCSVTDADDPSPTTISFSSFAAQTWYPASYAQNLTSAAAAETEAPDALAAWATSSS